MKRAMFAAAAAALLLATSATQLEAQGTGIVIDGYVGYIVPTGDFADATKASVGFGGSIGYNVSPAISIFGTLGLAKMKGTEEALEIDFDLSSYFLDVGFDLMAAAPQMSLILFAGGGGMHVKPDVQGAERKLNFALNGGAKFYLWFAESVGLMAGASVANAFTDEADIGTASLMTFPFTAGLALRF